MSGFSSGTVSLGSANTFTGTPQTIANNNAALVAQIIQAASGQTADIERWLSFAGVVLSKIDSLGNLSTNLVAGLGAEPTIASAATIAPTVPKFLVSGIAAITTITPPPAILAGGGSITIIPTGLFSLALTGNVALATTAVLGKALTLTYITATSLWYPSY